MSEKFIDTMDDSARKTDINGFVYIEKNPISKVGVFDYSGAQLGLSDERASQIFKVYRPAETLQDPEAIESFKLLPFTDEHAFLGDEDKGLMPAEKKGVHGFIGEQITFEHPYLLANLKIVSSSLKGTIDNGKIELSPGYRCMYREERGIFDGQPYDYVQYNMRGNHLALVDEGRTGRDVAILDHMNFTIDACLLAGDAEMTEEEKAKLAEAAKKTADEEAEKKAADEEAAATAEKATADADVEIELEKKDDEEKPSAMDSKILASLDSLNKRLAKIESGQTGMDSKLIGTIADRDALAKQLSDFVGTIDSARMTVDEVAVRGVELLGIHAVKGQERAALAGYFHGRTPEHKQKMFSAADGAQVDILSNWGAH